MEDNKKGQLGNLQGLVWGIVVIGIMIAIGLVILAELYDSDMTTSCTDPTNLSTCSINEAGTAINESIDAISEVPGWLVIIVIVVIASIILGLIQMFKSR